MKNILKLLILTVVLTSCGKDPMGLSSPINQQLDTAIANRVSRLNTVDASKVDKEVKGFWTSINLYDACTETSEQVDKYFDNWTLKLNLDKEFFTKVTQIHMKPEIIVAIKKNELKLLDNILSGQQ